MKNLYVVVEDEVHITINRRNRPAMIARASLNKLPKLQSMDHCWVAHKSKRDKTYYIQARVGGSGPITALHRFLVGLDGPDNSHLHVDHKDNDGTNNTDNNLRITTPRGNALNRRTAKTLMSGITPWGNRWRAQVGVGGSRKMHLGMFSTAEEASAAYQAARTRLLMQEVK